MIVSVDGADLFYSTRGSGPVCLVPSAMGTKPYERQIAPPFGDGRQLVFVDLRGGGQSTGDPSTLTFDQVADDFEAIRVALGVDEVAILGHSILGALAVEYGRRCPDSVSHVITVGTPPLGDTAWLQSASTEFFAQDASEERKRVFRDNMAALGPDASPRDGFRAQAPMRFFDPHTEMAPLYEGAVMKPQLLGQLMGPLTQGWDITTDPGSLRVPILLAHGRYDYTVPYSLWDDIAPVLPTATRHVFARSGHQPFCEEPEEFAMVVGAWMEKHP